jgi:archaellum component FlaF (FlaF/FlaG flagellin family)
MKKSVTAIIISLVVVVGAVYTAVNMGYDIAHKVDNTVYHDSDFNDINDDLYLHTLTFHEFNVMIPSTDTWCIIRECSTPTEEVVHVYSINVLASYIVPIGFILLGILGLLRKYLDYKEAQK